MTPQAKRWSMLVAIGHGVLFSLVLAKSLRLGSSWLGMPLPQEVTGTVFLGCSIVLGSIAAYFCNRSIRALEASTAIEAANQDRVPS